MRAAGRDERQRCYPSFKCCTTFIAVLVLRIFIGFVAGVLTFYIHRFLLERRAAATSHPTPVVHHSVSSDDIRQLEDGRSLDSSPTVLNPMGIKSDDFEGSESHSYERLGKQDLEPSALEVPDHRSKDPETFEERRAQPWELGCTACTASMCTVKEGEKYIYKSGQVLFAIPHVENWDTCCGMCTRIRGEDRCTGWTYSSMTHQCVMLRTADLMTVKDQSSTRGCLSLVVT